MDDNKYINENTNTDINKDNKIDINKNTNKNINLDLNKQTTIDINKDNNNKDIILNNNYDQKLLFSKLSYSLPKISPIILNSQEILKEKIILPKKILKMNKMIHIDYIYKSYIYSLNINDNRKLSELKKIIVSNLPMASFELELYIKDIKIDNNMDEKTIKNYFNENGIDLPYIIFVKKKTLYSNLENIKKIYPISFNYKLSIYNINSKDQIINISKKFCELELNKIFNNTNEYNFPFKIECNKNVYNIKFNYPEIAFDFKRYISFLKFKGTINKNIKVKFKDNINIKNNRYIFKSLPNISYNKNIK